MRPSIKGSYLAFRIGQNHPSPAGSLLATCCSPAAACLSGGFPACYLLLVCCCLLASACLLLRPLACMPLWPPLPPGSYDDVAYLHVDSGHLQPLLVQWERVLQRGVNCSIGNYVHFTHILSFCSTFDYFLKQTRRKASGSSSRFLR